MQENSATQATSQHAAIQRLKQQQSSGVSSSSWQAMHLHGTAQRAICFQRYTHLLKFTLMYRACHQALDSGSAAAQRTNDALAGRATLQPLAGPGARAGHARARTLCNAYFRNSCSYSPSCYGAGLAMAGRPTVRVAANGTWLGCGGRPKRALTLLLRLPAPLEARGSAAVLLRHWALPRMRNSWAASCPAVAVAPWCRATSLQKEKGVVNCKSNAQMWGAVFEEATGRIVVSRGRGYKRWCRTVLHLKTGTNKHTGGHEKNRARQINAPGQRQATVPCRVAGAAGHLSQSRRSAPARASECAERRRLLRGTQGFACRAATRRVRLLVATSQQRAWPGIAVSTCSEAKR